MKRKAMLKELYWFEILNFGFVNTCIFLLVHSKESNKNA